MVCLVTGSSRGLGKAVAFAFGKDGYRVAVHYRERKEAAEEVASMINESAVFQADVGNIKEVKAMIDGVISLWGRVDLLINNAGITKEALLIKTSEEEFDDILNTNLKGPFNLIRAAAPHMMKRKSGHIINISSYAGLKGRAGLSAYAASKAGLVGLTKTAARELAGYNIMVNAVLPGYMLTDMGVDANEKARERALHDSLIKEFTEKERVAEFVCALTRMKGVTGQVFNLDSRVI